MRANARASTHLKKKTKIKTKIKSKNEYYSFGRIHCDALTKLYKMFDAVVHTTCNVSNYTAICVKVHFKVRKIKSKENKNLSWYASYVDCQIDRRSHRMVCVCVCCVFINVHKTK